jgi:hypothetical protein
MAPTGINECGDEIYVDGRHLATYNSSTYFNHVDWIGTERQRQLYAAAGSVTCTSLPFRRRPELHLHARQRLALHRQRTRLRERPRQLWRQIRFIEYG